MKAFQFHDPDGEFIPLSTGEKITFTALGLFVAVMAIDFVLAIWGLL